MCSQLPNQVLKSISIIDSPGILSGEKQRISRGQCPPPPLLWHCQASLSCQQRISVSRGFYPPPPRMPPAPLDSPGSRAGGGGAQEIAGGIESIKGSAFQLIFWSGSCHLLVPLHAAVCHELLPRVILLSLGRGDIHIATTHSLGHMTKNKGDE